MSDEGLKRFIADWHWDAKSKRFAMKLGKFLFGFLDEMETAGRSRNTVSRYRGIVWCIGNLICNYGHHDSFDVQEIFGTPHAEHDYEFGRKLACSKNDIEYYGKAWRKIHKYAVQKGMAKPYVEDEE